MIILLFSPIASFVFNAGSIVGMTIGLIIILIRTFAPKIKTGLNSLNSKKGGKAVITAVALILAAAVACTSVITGFVMSKSTQSADIPKNTTAIVLGCGVNGDKPSLIRVFDFREMNFNVGLPMMKYN